LTSRKHIIEYLEFFGAAWRRKTSWRRKTYCFIIYKPLEVCRPSEDKGKDNKRGHKGPTMRGGIKDLIVDIRLHQGSNLSPSLFTIIMDELTRDIQDKVQWHMLFVDDIVLIDKMKTELTIS